MSRHTERKQKPKKIDETFRRAAIPSDSRLLCTLIGGQHDHVDVTQQKSGSEIVDFTADGDCDADGANGQTIINGKPQFAYAPNNQGLDANANAGYPNGEWHNVLIPDPRNRNIPLTIIVNGHTGWISSTAYQRPQFPREDPRRYLDSAAIPYIVVEDFIRRRATGVILGCKVLVTNTKTKQQAWMMVGDIGPLYKIGELSMKGCELVGLSSNPRTGGTDENILHYQIYPDQQFTWNGETFPLIRAVAAHKLAAAA